MNRVVEWWKPAISCRCPRHPWAGRLATHRLLRELARGRRSKGFDARQSRRVAGRCLTACRPPGYRLHPLEAVIRVNSQSGKSGSGVAVIRSRIMVSRNLPAPCSRISASACSRKPTATERDDAKCAVTAAVPHPLRSGGHAAVCAAIPSPRSDSQQDSQLRFDGTNRHQGSLTPAGRITATACCSLPPLAARDRWIKRAVRG